jgi:hypothetical protein
MVLAFFGFPGHLELIVAILVGLIIWRLVEDRR